MNQALLNFLILDSGTSILYYCSMLTIKSQLKEIIVKLGFDEKQVQIDCPVKSEHGDYSTNLAMVMAQERKTGPMDLAQEIAGRLASQLVFQQMFAKTEAIQPGFINFYLKTDYLVNKAISIIKQGGQYGQHNLGIGKKIMIEYSSPNTNK